MNKPKLPRVYYLVVYCLAVFAVASAAYFFSGISWKSWPELALLGLLFLYLHLESTKVDAGHALSTTVFFPVIYIYGPTPAALFAVLAGLVDGKINKREWHRILFNMSQLAICAMLNSVIFLKLRSGPNFALPGNALAITLGLAVNVALNTLLVSLMVALYSGVTWWSILSKAGSQVLPGNLGTAFIGIIFALFTASYGIWGLLGFGFLLAYLAWMFKTAAKISGERTLRVEMEEKLHIDEMTQAYNFRFLNEWLNEPKEEQAAILFMDIDDFKVFNDLYSHAEGDQVLRILVETVKNSIRAADKVIRYGGDEFIALLPGINREGALLAARRIVNNLEKLSFAKWQHKITISIGIAISPEDTSDKQQLLMMADQAMYAAKSAGKDTIRTWAPKQDPA